MYQIELRRAAYKDLEDIPADYARLIAKHIDSLEQNPRPTDLKKLKGGVGYSLRIGVYRLLYDIDDKAQSVTIYRIKHSPIKRDDPSLPSIVTLGAPFRLT